MITIQLHNLKFTGFHGLYEEEKILGTGYEVNVDVIVDVKNKITQLPETVDYVALYEIIKQRMAKPSLLLETVAQDLAELIHSLSNDIRSINISIKKLNPPIANFEGKVGISYKKEF